MKESIKFYMVPISPWTYLGMPRLKSLSIKYNVSIEIKPIDLFYIYKELGTKLVADRPLAVQKNRISELERWGKYLDIKLNVMPKFFPVNTDKACKLLLASDHNYEKNKTFDLAYNFSKALWAENQDLNDDKTLKNILVRFGYEKNLFELIEHKKINASYKENTKEALQNNVFGVPTFIYKEKLFWGQDRLFFLEEEMKKVNA